MKGSTRRLRQWQESQTNKKSSKNRTEALAGHDSWRAPKITIRH